MRTDQDILNEAYIIVSSHPGVDTTHINLSIKDGVITLAGSVHSAAAKWMAKEAIKHIHGIKGVHEELDIIP